MIRSSPKEAGEVQTPRSARGPAQRAARRSLAVLPALFTLGNCLSGFLAIFFASRKPETQLMWDWTPLTVGAAFIFMGMLLDALDGRIARITRQTSDLGEQLDSMADMVTFGVAPAYLAVQLVVVEAPFFSAKADSYFDRTVLVIACIYVACAALRLARFNIETGSGQVTDHLSFNGLPTPGAAGTVASLVLLHEHFLAHERAHWTMTGVSVGMVAIMLLTALAMVSRLRYAHVLNRYLRERAPLEYIALFVIVGLLTFIDLLGSLATGMVLYALSAPVLWVLHRIRRRPPAAGQPEAH